METGSDEWTGYCFSRFTCGPAATGFRGVHRLLLLRHAKAAWAAPGMSDFDRQLTASGLADAETLGHRMHEAGLRPELVLCSTARRARETLECLAPALSLSAAAIIHQEELYNSDATAYVEAIQLSPASRVLLVVGHNPMMEDLTFALPRSGNDPAAPAAAGFPTCGLAVIDFDLPFAALKPATGRLSAFLKPDRR